MIPDNNTKMDDSDSSIASRVSKRKRSRGAGLVALAGIFGSHRTGTAGAADAFERHRPTAAAAPERAASRRRLLDADSSQHRHPPGGSRPRPHPTLIAAAAAPTTPPSFSNRSPETQRHIATIKSKLGQHKHHGTGNPLAVRSPTTPKTLAVDNLASIIQSGHLGQDRGDMSGSIPKLRTERGSASAGSFWVNRVQLAGHYGWTGLILPPDADTSGTFPISKVTWFIVENDEERDRLESLLKGISECSADARWEVVRDRVVTLSQLAERLSGTGNQNYIIIDA